MAVREQGVLQLQQRRNKGRKETEDEEKDEGHFSQGMSGGRENRESSCWMFRVLQILTCQSNHGDDDHLPGTGTGGGGKQPFYCYYNNNFCPSAPLLHHRPPSFNTFIPHSTRINCVTTAVKDLYTNPLARTERLTFDSNVELASIDCNSSRGSVDGLSSDALSMSFGEFSIEHGHDDEDDDDDSTISSDVSSPLGWPSGRSDKCHREDPALIRKSHAIDNNAIWEERSGSTRDIDLLEIELMKERFAKLLLGEDMSGSGQGVCTALAISNAITNLSACVFGELWRLEPLPVKRKALWRREMEWLLSVADHVIEMVPSQQTLADGSILEVMITRPRSDLQIYLPALMKLDAMLLECLDNFHDTEFGYNDKGNFEDCRKLTLCRRHPHHEQEEEKWWLPSPKVPPDGLSEEARKDLQHRKESINQILKAALAINNQVLSEMEVPDVYWDALPKSGKARLGEAIYKHMVSHYFSSETLLCSLDLSTEHKALDIANRLEAAVHLRHPRRGRNKKKFQNASGKDKTLRQDKVRSLAPYYLERREVVARRSENVLMCLKQRFPGLPQTLLDVTKIQCNRDVGQAILESYSRVLESLAFNIMARIDNVLYVDDMAKIPLLSLSGGKLHGFLSSN